VFANRSQIVINQQKPLHEIWLAAKAGGFHYRFDEDKKVWLDTKGAGEVLCQSDAICERAVGHGAGFKALA
jgi:CyaY protein